LVDGDVQAGVADRVARVLKAARVAELGQDRDRRQRADPVDLLGQCAAAGLRARVRAQREVDRPDLQLDRVDHLQGDRQLLGCRGRELQASDPFAV
jgi:hypothetical protein